MINIKKFLSLLFIALCTYHGINAASKEVKNNVQTLKESRSCKGCNLQGADLKGANLQNVNLNAYKTYCTMEYNPYKKCSSVNRPTNLKDANLKNANLQGAKMKEANLEGADFSGANLKVANLLGAKTKNADLSEAIMDNTTRLPNGKYYDPDADTNSKPTAPLKIQCEQNCFRNNLPIIQKIK